MSNSLEELARRIAALERSVEKGWAPGLGHSSFEGAIQEYDETGEVLVQRVGRQFDGTHTTAVFNGPVPPACTTPIVEPYAGGLAVTWDGNFLDGAVVPMDFARVEIHLSTDPLFVPNRDTLHATVETAQGATVAVLLPATTEFYVALVAMSQAGVAGATSTKVAATPLPLVDQAQFNQLEADLAALDAEVVQVAGAATQAQQDATAAHNAAVAAQETADAKASLDYIASRGTDLVTNGTGLLGDNTNFPTLTYSRADVPQGAMGAFDTGLGDGSQVISDEVIPVDLSRRYLFRFKAKQRGASDVARMYSGLAPYDAQKQLISPQHYMFQPGTTTTLAADLKPGDTTVTLTSAANWNNAAGTSTHLRRMIFWNWTDPDGRTWPAETYSRDVTIHDLWADGAISGNVITLRAPWSGALKPAGTQVSNGSAGGSYMYGGAANTIIPKEWTEYSAVYGGAHTNKAASASTSFPPGTAGVRLIWLVNRTSGAVSVIADSQHSIASISFSDATAALKEADAAKAAAATAQTAADNAAAAASTADSKAVAAQADADAAAAAAATAQTAADAAAQDAADAAGIAGGKADVLIQSTIPAVEMQKATTLWIDTTSGTNTPKRWSGSAWVAVTDKAATDAAAAAAAAQSAASTAQSTADAAASAASTADSKAVAAQQAADDAAAAASTAQSAADAAAQDAATAAGIAGGKADVLIQSTTPATDMQKATTLWIDTTNGANTPKRWSGSAWVVVTDKAATDAATAAANAQTTANNAATAAANAQTTADNAATAASAAQGTADTALSTANGKNKITWSTSAPSGTGTAGDIWFRLSGAIIIGQWEYTTTWVARTIDNAVIANLNAGKITAGFLAAARIAAGSISANKLNVGPSNGIVDHTFADADVRTARVNASGAALTFANTADSLEGRMHARLAATASSNFYLGAATDNEAQYAAIPVEKGRKYRFGAWIRRTSDFAATSGFRPMMRMRSNTGTNNYTSFTGGNYFTPTTTWTWYEWEYTPSTTAVAVVPAFQITDGTAGAILIDSPSFTPKASSTLIEDGAVTTPRLASDSVTAIKIASEAVEADKIAANAITAVKIAAGQITADKFAATLLLASTIIVGTPGGNRVEITPTSIRKVSSTGVVSVDIPADGPAVFAGTIRASTFETAEAGVNIDIGGYINAAMPDGAISWQVYSPGITGYTPPHVRGITQTDGAVGTNTLWEASSGAPVDSNTLASRSGLVLKSQTTGGVRSEATLRGQDILLDGDVVIPSGKAFSVGALTIRGPVYRTLRRTANLSIASGSWVGLTWSVVDQDVGGIGSGGSGYYSVPEGGIYSVTALVSMAAAGGLRALRLITHPNNGSQVLGMAMYDTAASVTRIYSLQSTIFLTAGQQIRVEVFQNTGVTINVTADTASDPTRLVIARSI